MIKVGIIEDDLSFIEDFYESLERIENVKCLAKSTNSKHFFHYFKYEPNLKLDIVFLDIKLKEESGLDIIPKILKKIPDVEIIIFTIVEDSNTLIKSFCLGAVGYLLKEEAFSGIENYINIIQKGGSAISPKMAKKLIQYFTPPQLNIESPFSEKESHILKLMAEGWSYKEVADKVNLSIDGVRFYIKRIYKSLHINSKSELIRLYTDGKIFLE